jgi:hypothetical protein
LGKAERFQEEEVEEVPEEVEAKDLSDLEGKKVNKAGNVVDENGKLFGRVVDGEISRLIGKKCDAEGKIWSSSGKVIGTAELVPVDERDEESGGPFEDFPDAIVDSKGNIVFNGQVVGKLIEGDAKKLAGKKIDKDGEVVDKIGNVLGKAERWTEPDEPEAEVIDMSALAGKRVRLPQHPLYLVQNCNHVASLWACLALHNHGLRLECPLVIEKYRLIFS